MHGRRTDDLGGFSLVRVILSDALPSEAFHPDMEERLNSGYYERPKLDKTRKACEL